MVGHCEMKFDVNSDLNCGVEFSLNWTLGFQLDSSIEKRRTRLLQQMIEHSLSV